jgi:hypothetical protein
MNDDQRISFKNKLKQTCKSLIEQRMQATNAAIRHAQEAANNEEKSSAGDKYETSRAMSHLEKDMHSKQLAEIVKELAILHAINVNKICKAGEPGAFLQCGSVSFFIVAGMGKQCIDEQQVYFLSPNAPLAKQLYNKKPGDAFIFNHVEMKIEDVY